LLFYFGQFIDAYTNNFHYSGTRTTGDKCGTYLLTREILKALIRHSHYFSCIEAIEIFRKGTAAEPKSQNIFTNVLINQNPF